MPDNNFNSGQPIRALPDLLRLPSSFFGGVNNDVDISAKASAGYLLGVIASNKNVALRYLQIFNKNAAPVNGDTPVTGGVFEIPAGSASAPSTFFLDSADLGTNGMFLDKGIAIGISTTAATFTAATATDHVISGRFV